MFAPLSIPLPFCAHSTCDFQPIANSKQWQRWWNVIHLIRLCYVTKSHFYDYIMLYKTLSYIRLEEETHCWFDNVSSYVGETHGKQELCASFRTWGQSPAGRQQNVWKFGYIATRTWIMPTTWMNLEVYSFPNYSSRWEPSPANTLITVLWDPKQRRQLSCPRSLANT